MEKGIRLYALGVALALGCGSGETSLKDDLVGSWIYDDASTAVVYSFTADGAYEYNLAYLLNPTLEVLAIIGDYELRTGERGGADDNGTYLFLQPRLASCPSGPSPVGFTVELDGDSLLLSSERGAELFGRISDGEGGSGLIRYGCFTPEGFFPYSIQPL